MDEEEGKQRANVKTYRVEETGRVVLILLVEYGEVVEEKLVGVLDVRLKSKLLEDFALRRDRFVLQVDVLLRCEQGQWRLHGDEARREQCEHSSKKGERALMERLSVSLHIELMRALFSRSFETFHLM